MLQKAHYFANLCYLDEVLVLESKEQKFTAKPCSEINQEIPDESLNPFLAQLPHLQTKDTYNIPSISKILLLHYQDLIHQPSYPQTRPANERPHQLQLTSCCILLELNPTAISLINPKLLSEKPSLINPTMEIQGFCDVVT